MDWKYIMALFVLVLVYLLIGGAVFQAIEQGNEEEMAAEVANVYENFLINATCVDAEDFRHLVLAIVSAYDNGVLVLPTQGNSTESSQSNWDYFTSVFFSLAVITTIGYGNVSPATTHGQAFFVFYALIGIPLMLLLLAQIGTKMSELCINIADRVNCFSNKKLDGFMDTAIIVALGFFVFLLCPSAVISLIEGWSMREAFYFAIVSLSTVGFGDYVAAAEIESKTWESIYRLFLCIWIFFGLAWFAGVISSVQDKLHTRIENAKTVSWATGFQAGLNKAFEAAKLNQKNKTTEDQNKTIAADDNKPDQNSSDSPLMGTRKYDDVMQEPDDVTREHDRSNMENGSVV